MSGCVAPISVAACFWVSARSSMILMMCSASSAFGRYSSLEKMRAGLASQYLEPLRVDRLHFADLAATRSANCHADLDVHGCACMM
jgi:predicted protein tyrosine phosphatase